MIYIRVVVEPVVSSGKRIRSDDAVVKIVVVVVPEQVVPGDHVFHSGAVKFRDEPQPNRELMRSEVVLHPGFHAWKKKREKINSEGTRDRSAEAKENRDGEKLRK